MAFFKRISFEERELISNFVSQGKSIRWIAKELHRSPSSISMELRRFNMGRKEYRAISAQEHVSLMKRKAGRKKKIHSGIILILQVLINEKRFSPKQASEFLKRQYPNYKEFHFSHETIYLFIYSNGTYLRLRRKRKLRRKRGSYIKPNISIPNRISIHKRPSEINFRQVPGHWEGDLMIGKNHQTVIGTLVERVSRFVAIVWIGPKKNSQIVLDTFASCLETYPPHMRVSLTYDNGIEAYNHQNFTLRTGMPIYFADPGCPWQRGSNENTNGLIREFFPKGTDFSDYSPEDLMRVQNLLNDRPRKILDFASPKEIFHRFSNAQTQWIN
jgi:transposase, IS30 family